MEKLKIIRLTVMMLFVLAVTAFIFISPDNTTGYLYDPSETPPLPDNNNNTNDSFLIGCMHDGVDGNFKYIKDALGFNLWHIYCGDTTIGGIRYPTGWIRSGAPGDNLFADSGAYFEQVKKVLENIGNHQMKALLHRPKIEYLCYGQRSDYQCEPAPLDTGLWFYSFDYHNAGITETDSGQVVIHCRAEGNPHDAAGFVVKRLKANTEQCHVDEGFPWRADNGCKWIIKPKIRIDPAFANNPENYNKPVCRIYVLNQDGHTFKDVILRVRNFLVDNGGKSYNGRYLEEYRYEPGDSVLTCSGAWGHSWWFNARGRMTEYNEEKNPDINHADIQVWWSGSCDMWIDYVRVDNEVANDLLTADTSNKTHQTYMKWLQWESELACSSKSPYRFYIELFEFNNIPCIAYVNRKIDSITYASCGKHFTVMGETLCQFQNQMPRSAVGEIITPEKVNRMYYARTGSREIFVGDPYPLNAVPPPGCFGNNTQFSRLPGTLRWTGGDSVLADIVPPEEYDAWLENLFDAVCSLYETTGWTPRDYENSGAYLFMLKHGNEISRLRDIPLIVMIQAHQWVSKYEVDREPTNEELDMMTNLAVSYGARGIIYWGISSFYGSNCSNSRAIMTKNITPRYTNVYGEPKFEKIKEIVKRLKSWAPAVMSFNNKDRQSYIFRNDNERYSLMANSYFRWLVTGRPGSHQNVCPEWHQGIPAPPPEAGLVYDCEQNTYLQAATFENSEPDTHYFMIINRRCSPYYAPGVDSRFPNGENGGRRKIKVLFDTNNPQLSASVRWKITEVGNPNTSYIFNKTANSYIDLGWFMPAEGKLYKMEPSE